MLKSSCHAFNGIWSFNLYQINNLLCFSPQQQQKRSFLLLLTYDADLKMFHDNALNNGAFRALKLLSNEFAGRGSIPFVGSMRKKVNECCHLLLLHLCSAMSLTFPKWFSLIAIVLDVVWYDVGVGKNIHPQSSKWWVVCCCFFLNFKPRVCVVVLSLKIEDLKSDIGTGLLINSSDTGGENSEFDNYLHFC